MKYKSVTYIYYDVSMDTEIHEKFKTWEDFVAYTEKYIEPVFDSEKLAEFWNLVYDTMIFTVDNQILIDLS